MEEKARVFAIEKHRGQKRKFSGEDYSQHPIRVCEIVREFTNKEELLCVALLHDTLEDTDTTYEELEREFGLSIADMVFDLTNDKEEIKVSGKTSYLSRKMKNNETRCIIGEIG